MTTERRNLAEKIRVVLAKGGDHYDVVDAVLPQLAPPQDVVEGARSIVLRKWCGRFISLAESKELEADIAAFATAHAEKEREADIADEQEIERVEHAILFCDSTSWEDAARSAAAAVRGGAGKHAA